MTITAQQQTSPRITPCVVWIHRKKILTQEHIFISVAVQIGHTDAQSRRKLGFFRQRHCFKMIPAIEEDHRFQRVRLERFHSTQLVAINLLHARPAISFKARPFFRQERNGRAHRFQSSIRHFFSQCGLVVRFDHFDCPVAIQIATVNFQRTFATGVVLRVESPIGSNDVQPSISVQIARGHTSPPACVSSQSKLRGNVFEGSIRVFEHPHWPPFAGQNQLRLSVSVQIAKDGAAH